jgi:hypothetical protein
LTWLKTDTSTLGDARSTNTPQALIAATARLRMRGAVSVRTGDGARAPGEDRCR